ncbi:MAG: (Fe-S)-binding protein [Longimicrobiales bacterium]|nr:(Fe-S)-binding protein [Longimicrobiales bacterium]
MRVALFATCLADQFHAEACADAVRLLRHLGIEVDFPEAQTCCGQPGHNSGHAKDARLMAEHTVAVFAGSEHVVLPSGSCAAMVRRVYPKILGTEAADTLAARTWELSQFLVEVLGVERLGSGLTGMRIAYHHGCHALRELGVEEEPVTLLRGAGAQVVDWEADRECCGFGGLFSAKLPEVSAGMADRKLDTLPEVDVLTSADGGCLLQLGGRDRVGGGGLTVTHLARLLWKATGAAGGTGPADPSGGEDGAARGDR